MSWTRVTCWALLCDRCEDGWSAENGQPHFGSRSEATAHARDAGWVVTAGRALCPDCTLYEACALAGHRWQLWEAAGPFPSLGGGSWRGSVRYCGVCEAAQWDPPVQRAAQLRRTR